MKLNDFIKKDNIKKPSNYKVVVGNSPKEQQLEKQASQVVVLETKNSELNIKVDKLEQENKFLQEQVKINQHEKDEFKAKANQLEDVKAQLVQKDNRITDVLEECHELSVRENSNKEKIKELQIDLNNKTGELAILERNHKEVNLNLENVTADYNGMSAELNRIKDFSEKTQDEYNKIRDRNTVLLKEREHLSKLKAEFEAKSIRLGEELNKTLDNMKTLKNQLEKITNGKADTDKENIKSTNLNIKLKKDLNTVVDSKHKLESELIEAKQDMESLSDVTHAYKKQLEKERHESMEWNIAKQQLKLGNAYTYPNKLGFGASPFFKLREEK
tara:strand:- start:989 stop:1978 length:990 start_codon:yes stop_codon:yes gene_type:complete